LVDRFLELVVEDGAVGDDDDGVKLLRALRGVEGGELMGDPGDGVGFTGAGAVLDEVFLAGAFGAGCFDELADDVPLVIAGEDHRLLLILPAVPVLLFLDFEVNEAGEDVEQVVGQQHFVPEVVGGVAVDVLRRFVARAAVFGSAIERGKTVDSPASRVVMATSYWLTAKWTSAPRLKVRGGSAFFVTGSAGRRADLYCLIARSAA
jgi:hypothetical protein